jgi:hypothetical protein
MRNTAQPSEHAAPQLLTSRDHAQQRSLDLGGWKTQLLMQTTRSRVIEDAPRLKKTPNTSHVPKKNALSLLRSEMKFFSNKSPRNTMPIPANEKPEWLLQSPG